jgi:hypothetical protein
MSEAISETTGKRYGVQRVCRVWERTRSSLYARRQRTQRIVETSGLFCTTCKYGYDNQIAIEA